MMQVMRHAASKGGVVRKTQHILAARTGLSESLVKRIALELCASGDLEPMNKRGRVNRYRVVAR